MRYMILEMWENSEPHLVTKIPNDLGTENEEPAEVFRTDNYEEALEEQDNCQDGYILDFELMKIIKP